MAKVKWVALLASLLLMGAGPRWLELPPTPILPAASRSGLAPVNDIKMWYAVFGHGPPVVMLHGGLANSNYWANQVPVLARHHTVIVCDSRGHGRSTRSDKPYTYELMASDVVGLLDYLKVPKAAVVGWSDGGIIGLELSIHYPERVSKVFAFAANYTVDGVRDDLGSNDTFNRFIDRCRHEYPTMSPTPTDYEGFLAAIEHMWHSEPALTKDDLRSIHVPMWIVDGDHDEAIKREQTEEMAAIIPGAGLLIQPNVSHFSFLQDPDQFTADVLRFLDEP